jgi:trimeric autotransporter adhesin
MCVNLAAQSALHSASIWPTIGVDSVLSKLVVFQASSAALGATTGISHCVMQAPRDCVRISVSRRRQARRFAELRFNAFPKFKSASIARKTYYSSSECALRQLMQTQINATWLSLLLGLLLVFTQPSSAQPSPEPNPNLDLRVGASSTAMLALADGSTIVAGNFGLVNNVEQSNIAKVLPNGSVDATWNVSVINVNKMLLDGDRLFLIGVFTSVNGIARNGLAVVSLSTGALDAWDPNMGSSAFSVFNDATRLGDYLYVAGDFTQLGSVSRTHLAKIHAVTGAVDATWNPVLNASVRAIANDGSSLYVGGSFMQINGLARRFAAKLDNVTGAPAAWAPSFGGSVIDVAVDAGFYYAVGCFTSVDGVPRNYLARVNASSGVLDASWNPTPGGGCTTAVAVTASQVYVGGAFPSIGGQPIAILARVAKTTGAVDTSFNPQPSRGPGFGLFVFDIAEISASEVLIAGNFLTLGGSYAASFAKISRSAGELLQAINIENRGSVRALLALSDDKTLVGGVFSRVANQSPAVLRQGLIRLQSDGQLDTGFTTNVNGFVLALSRSNNHLYVGGSFMGIGNSTLEGIGRLLLDGSFDPSWTPAMSLNSSVASLTFDNATDSVLVGGTFSSFNGQARNRLAEIRASDGGLGTWNPNANGSVRNITLIADQVYVGGTFSSVGGQAKLRLAKLSRATGLADSSFAADANGTVTTLLAGPNNTLYVGGSFTSLGALARPGFGRLLTSTGAPDATWNIFLASGDVQTLASIAGGVYLGGNFTAISSQTRNNFARLRHDGTLDPLFAPALSGAVFASVAQSARVTVGGAFTQANGARALVAYATQSNIFYSGFEDSPF